MQIYRQCQHHGRRIAGPNGDCPALPILPLTDNATSVTTQISNMNANGGTNIQSGTIWGFRVLSPGEPFAQGRAYNTATAKVLIIMTDGQNWSNIINATINNNYYYTWYGFMHPDADRTRIGTYNAEDDTSFRSQDECPDGGIVRQNAKSAGITIYTVGLNPPDTATRTMLQNCATRYQHGLFPQRLVRAQHGVRVNRRAIVAIAHRALEPMIMWGMVPPPRIERGTSRSTI